MDINELLDVMRKLRDPEQGCPWDLKQNFASIVPYTIEEVYEVAEAIDANDMDELKLELGDLLFQVVFYSQLAKEENAFEFSDVVEAIVTKMVRRHPHVFSDTAYQSDEEFSKAWEQSKREEKQQSGQLVDSAIDGVSKVLPALKFAQKTQSKAAKVGFDWEQIAPVYEKVTEELSEVREAEKNNNQTEIEDEIGDLLFSVVNLSRHLKVDAEEALRKSTGKFSQRFRKLEAQCKENNQSIDTSTEQQLLHMWDIVKQSEY